MSSYVAFSENGFMDIDPPEQNLQWGEPLHIVDVDRRNNFIINEWRYNTIDPNNIMVSFNDPSVAYYIDPNGILHRLLNASGVLP